MGGGECIIPREKENSICYFVLGTGQYPAINSEECVVGYMCILDKRKPNLKFFHL